jgi:hypothetical protein
MDPQTLQMLMALSQQQQQGTGVTPGGAQANANLSPQAGAQQSAMQGMPQAPLMNGQNASLGGTSGSSATTPQDMYAAMMQSPPMMAYGGM